MVVRHEPTLADVAEVAGVSLTTVSRVLNNRGYLSQATKDRVAKAIAQLNYRPNQVARALHGKSTNIIGVIVPTVALPFFGELADEIETALAEHHYRMLVCNSMGRAEREREYLDLLVSHRVDGIISGAHNDDLSEYQTVRMPLVTIDRDISPTIPNIRCANEAAAHQATRLLLDRGALRPALLTSRTGPHNRREAGYRSVLEQAGVEPLIFTVDFHTPDDERARLIDAHLDAAADQIDAVFATDDLSAAAVLDWAERHGRRVPEDFKVIGFDGTSAVRRALPGLATVRQPLTDMAHAAVEVLLAQIQAHANGEDATPVDSPIELPGELLPGKTT
ncbi:MULTISPECIES: LacI family DNA-binding transcriptional regulator [Actinomyces]|uniref:Laci bacterial regulatory protein hth signature n=1 Tax=Actinomyces glycerinitolerans TaxID=1892869 RepID=A0A1M4S1S3_9ACTO|nr:MULTISPECIES: LacI family DNA-binding transcriptional regulator [Actinomyces]RAX19920.1 LacI family transcriptional regulator [Actinomyces sp. Z5]RAX23039.1 LacI family transcriptional regulator [Actinomyces sp. Z3]SHE26152.1 laci bacterial regulatory protein hth signature [Actinomyces glycerinitolerans]